ncbi:tyrosinase cofactor [Streptomyces sp. UNOC14_S4]|uniref:tyrosinase cofactor n=1 Tax=Streptomyces sp. UNOC14_S4 TaxID=2872340 RepID=UPI001E4B69D4|nr:tyrosinase cofactor [Streptomyces sp. UNOC14_S4]MCC3767056.1 tyrosinase cofactor [Streptomyces sp. UNOC14_S4]
MTAVTRRNVLRAAFTAAVVTGTGAALAPIVLADSTDGTATDAAGSEHPAGHFDEIYRGRRIQGGPVDGTQHGGAHGAHGAQPAAYRAAAASSAPSAPSGPGIQVSIDGRPLHVMRRADGSYLSLVNHYESFPTPLAVARAAVDTIGTAQLSTASLHHH